jgi:hypothetical protein
MRDVVNQSEEDSEKVLLEIRQGKPVAPMTANQTRKKSDKWKSDKEIQ